MSCIWMIWWDQVLMLIQGFLRQIFIIRVVIGLIERKLLRLETLIRVWRLLLERSLHWLLKRLFRKSMLVDFLTSLREGRRSSIKFSLDKRRDLYILLLLFLVNIKVVLILFGSNRPKFNGRGRRCSPTKKKKDFLEDFQGLKEQN